MPSPGDHTATLQLRAGLCSDEFEVFSKLVTPVVLFDCLHCSRSPQVILLWAAVLWCGSPRPARRSICTAAAHQRRAPPLRKYSQLDARQTAGSSQLAISVQILCKLQRPRHGGGQRAVWDNSYLRTSHTYHHYHIMMLTCYHAQLCGSRCLCLVAGLHRIIC